MKLTFLASLAFLGVALAVPAQSGQKKIPEGQPCKKDGSMGVCATGYCLQDANSNQGVCKSQ
ncbi:hypothetical protein BDV59DRAFT_185520 [Aspergillus ambiguus]|uniref:uncharacterized protein n=1 Tax=Aspergillus ambiguus TaxID=176160 RepID=UPI003CCE2593